MERMDRRGDAQPRPLTLIPNFVETADGSCLITAGKTRVICTASVEEGVPPFLRGEGRGWVTAEYAMLPASTGRRKARDGIKKDGRGVEIQRLIGRSLRQAVDMRLLGERTITLDCDVLQADGGTRTASITGAYVALVMAVHKLMQNGLIAENPIIAQVAAISVGVVDGTWARVDISTLSGAIELAGEAENAEIETASGKVDIAGALGALDFESVSGDLILATERALRLDAETESGSIYLTLPAQDGFTLDYETKSGAFRSALTEREGALITCLDDHATHYSVPALDGGEMSELEISTVSGTLTIDASSGSN